MVDISGSLNEEGQDVEEGSYDPLKDISFLEKEIDYWFKDIILRQDWQKFIRKIEQEKLSFLDMLEERLTGISIKRSHIIQAIKDSKLDFEHVTNWTEEDLLQFASILRQIAKPIIIAANKIDRHSSEVKFRELIQNYPGKVIPCTALAEYWLRKFDQDQLIDYEPGNPTFTITKKKNYQKMI